MLPDVPTWPHLQTSRVIDAAGLSWHVQIMGTGPCALLLHGTGASTHSWAGLAPRLAASFTVVAPDLPGHGFTSRPPDDRLSIRGMAADVETLVETLVTTLRLPPFVVIVGHSAGAAIALQIAADGRLATRAVVGINAALATPPLVNSPILTRAVRMVGESPGAAWLAGVLTGVLLDSTGSVVGSEQRARYRHLLRSPARIGAVMSMMANWDLADLWRSLEQLKMSVTLIAGGRDRWVPPSVAVTAAARLPHATVVMLPGTGHLVHEEAPDAVARIVGETIR